MRRMSKPSDAQAVARSHNFCFKISRGVISQMEYLIHTPTVTPEAVGIARRIQNEAKLLTLALKERVDK